MTSKIPEQFIPRPRSMLENNAYRSLSLAARRFMERIELEHLRHGGKDNGKLPVTHRDFVKYGIWSSGVGSARCETITKGFVRITRKGRSGKHGTPTEYRLTYIHANNRPPTNEWKRYNGIRVETAAISRRNPQQIGSEIQENPAPESSANGAAESVALSRESSIAASLATSHIPDDAAAAVTALTCAYCGVADAHVSCCTGRGYNGDALHRRCRHAWLKRKAAVA